MAWDAELLAAEVAREFPPVTAWNEALENALWEHLQRRKEERRGYRIDHPDRVNARRRALYAERYVADAEYRELARANARRQWAKVSAEPAARAAYSERRAQRERRKYEADPAAREARLAAKRASNQRTYERRKAVPEVYAAFLEAARVRMAKVHAVGNGVPLPLGRAIARAVRRAIGEAES